MVSFSSSTDIRKSAVGGLPSLLKAAKEAQPGHISGLQDMAKEYVNKIVEAMNSEFETEVLIAQAEAIKDIMDEAGDNYLQPESVQLF